MIATVQALKAGRSPEHEGLDVSINKPVNSLRLMVSLYVISTLLAAPLRAADPGPEKKSTLVTEAKSSKQKVNSSWATHINLPYSALPKDARRVINYTLVSKPGHGTVIMPAKHNKYYYKSNGKATYTSDKDYVGPDAFTWKVNDGHGDSKVATCTINVIPAPPVPQLRDTVLATQDQALHIPVTFIGGGGFVYATKHTNPSHGKVTYKDNTFTYTPAPGFTGTDSFTWHMTYRNKGTAPDAATAPTVARTVWIVVKKIGVSDWTQWRADEWRSGFTSMKLPEKLHLQWKRDIPKSTSPFAARGAKIYPDIDYCRPVQLGKTLFVPVTASDRLSAYDTDSGKLRWSFYASGAIRRPPAALSLPDGKSAVIFGSDDGWVYCLHAADGTVRWKFRAAPNNRKAIGFGRLSSVWPVWASPVISKGKVYFAAGYIPSFALYGYCLDAATGAIVWKNDGRITDMWNTSAFGPLAVSYDGTRIFGSVEGASRPWVLDSASGSFLGHVGLGFEFPGSGKQRGRDTKRNGTVGWYGDGNGSFNIAEPMTITAGTQTFTPESVKALGVSGTVASMLAGDQKLFVTTAEGSIYCFGGKNVTPAAFPNKPKLLPPVSDDWTTSVKRMLSREDLKQGLALVLGVQSGRLVEELAKQSSLMVVAVDPDHKKLQALRARMDAAGLYGAHVSTLEGNPLDFAFAPYQAALITSEDVNVAGWINGKSVVERLYKYTRPFGGEIWLPTSSDQHAKLEEFHGQSKSVPRSEISRTGKFTQLKRTGLPDEALRIKPPFGLIAFGSEPNLAASNPLNNVWRYKDIYSWLPLKAKSPGYVPPEPKHNDQKGYPSISTVSTTNSIFSSMTNPLFSTVEQFPGVPSSGNDGSCTALWTRYGDFGLTHGKISSFFDASSNYWGRLFVPEAGGCPGRTFMWNGAIVSTATPVPGSACGCSAAMQFSNFAMAPMENEENWINYQRVRTSNSVEEIPVKHVGVNFGAPGDRYVSEDKTLWTHHPYSGRYGRCSYNFESEIEALPLLPVSYAGNVKSTYHHSAQMERTSDRYRGWVSASYVKGMTKISIPLAQPVVATRTTTAPKVDGELTDECWKGQKPITFAANRVVIDRDRKTGLPKPDEQCYAMVRYDDENLYVATGVHAEYGPPTSWRSDTRKSMTVTLNSREQRVDDLILTGAETFYRGKTKATKTSKGIDPGAWSYAGGKTGTDPYTAEMAISWKALADAGLWKEQLLINIRTSGSDFVAKYTPLYLDTARGPVTRKQPHTVRLFFAEMEDQKPGQRIFDVSLQGKPVLEKLDVAKEAGGFRRELIKEFKNIEIADELILDFKPQAGQPMLSGIEIIGTYSEKDLAPNAAPKAHIETSALTGPAPFRVTLSAEKSQDPDGQIVQCAWDTGDGRLAKGSMLHHVYAEPGTYKVHLLIRDNHGAMATNSVTVTVSPGQPAAFVCKIRAKGGDYATLSAWEAAMRSALVSTTRNFKVASIENVTAKDHGQTVTFTGGAKGTLRSLDKNVAVITAVRGQPAPGKVTLAGGHSFVVADLGTSPDRSLIFTVKDRGTYAATDDGKSVTFTGGGTGKLRHVNGSDLAYLTECRGIIKPGAVTCASGHSFVAADSGHPIFSMVAECYNDWTTGLTDSIKAPGTDSGWVTDPLRCVVIRAAAGHGHKGKMKDAQGTFTGFTLKGHLDASAIPNLRIERVIVDTASKLSLGAGASVNRVLAGSIHVTEGGMAANSMATTFSAGNTSKIENHSTSYYTMNLRDGRKQKQPPVLLPSRIGFYSCTGLTFDPGNQVNVEFINCLAAPGGKGFLDAGYAQPAYTNHCVSTDDTAARWDRGDRSQGNATKQSVKFLNAAGGVFHLAPDDIGARKRGAPGLGPDIDGQERTASHNDVGADWAAAK